MSDRATVYPIAEEIVKSRRRELIDFLTELENDAFVVFTAEGSDARSWYLMEVTTLLRSTDAAIAVLQRAWRRRGDATAGNACAAGRSGAGTTAGGNVSDGATVYPIAEEIVKSRRRELIDFLTELENDAFVVFTAEGSDARSWYLMEVTTLLRSTDAAIAVLQRAWPK